MLVCCAAAIVLSIPAPFATRAAGTDAPARGIQRVEVTVPRIVSSRMVDRGDGVLRMEIRTNDPAVRAMLDRLAVPEQWTTRTRDGRKVTTIRQTFVSP